MSDGIGAHSAARTPAVRTRSATVHPHPLGDERPCPDSFVASSAQPA